MDDDVRIDLTEVRHQRVATRTCCRGFALCCGKVAADSAVAKQLDAAKAA